MVSKVLASDSPCEDFKEIDVETTALVSRPIILVPSSPGTAELITDQPGKISVQVDVPQQQLLVVSESYDTGWRVHVDSQPASLERVNGDFFGCLVDKGKHRVEFEFLPTSLRIGRIVSLSACALALLIAFGPAMSGWFRRNPRSIA
jgi:hypothetical protein